MNNYPRIDRPTEPGFYWHRYNAESPWSVARIWPCEGRLRVAWPWMAESPFLEDDHGGEWRGPIPPPPKE